MSYFVSLHTVVSQGALHEHSLHGGGSPRDPFRQRSPLRGGGGIPAAGSPRDALRVAAVRAAAAQQVMSTSQRPTQADHEFATSACGAAHALTAPCHATK